MGQGCGVARHIRSRDEIARAHPVPKVLSLLELPLGQFPLGDVVVAGVHAAFAILGFGLGEAVEAIQCPI